MSVRQFLFFEQKIPSPIVPILVFVGALWEQNRLFKPRVSHRTGAQPALNTATSSNLNSSGRPRGLSLRIFSVVGPSLGS